MYKTLIVLLLSLTLLGCASKRPAAEAGAGETLSTDTAGTGATASGMDTPTVSATPTDGAAGSGPPGDLATRRVIYFEFDRADIRASDATLVEAHARYLVRNPGVRVRLEGHADAQGTREYNIGLGERRAQAVRRAMQLQGVADAQTTTVSFGEERPAVAGDDEAAYSQNRRVEIVYGP